MLVHKKNVQYIYIKLHVQVGYKDRGYGLFQWPKSKVNLKVKVYFISLLTPIFLKASAAAAASKLLQSCPTLCDAIDGSPPGSPVPGILQARTLEWVTISFSNAWKWKVKGKSLSRVRLLATPWTAGTRLLHPWDFLGKNTGVGCHCLLH